MNPEWRTRYEFGTDAAMRAGNIALGYFDQGVSVEWKEDQSPVTIADRAAEQSLRESLLKAFPNDGFLGEEFGDTPGSTGFRWIVDPIDGTRCFVRNIPLWATLVGLEYKGEMIAGHCYVPAANQMYRALRGDGAYRDLRKIHVSNTEKLEDALMSYSSLSYFEKAGKESAFMELLRKSDRSRGYGDYLGFVLVAQGSCDLMVDHGVHIWDVAGLKVIIEEAGGKFTDWDGQLTVDRPDALATNGKLHDVVLSILNK